MISQPIKTSADLTEIFSIANYLTKTDKKIVEDAFYFAQNAHKNIKRKSGEPYFIHLVATAKNLAELRMDGKTLAAGLLHDSIEDGVATKEEIIEKFGEEIYSLVDGVTKLEKVRFRGMERHNESLRKLFVATSKDIRALLIKFADRLHNIQTLEYVRPDKRERIATETLEIYAPLAYRLGITSLSKKLEDASFPYVFPEDFKKVQEILNKQKKQSLDKLEKFSKNMKRRLMKNGVKKFKTEQRIKGIYSLYRKLLRKKWDETRIYDIAALRIILPDIKTCYEVLGIIHQHFRPMPGRIKDYIAFPKPNGYRSIHTTVFTGDGSIIEVQIRTEQMHDEATFGAASNLNYKAASGYVAGAKNQDGDWVSKLLGIFKSKTENNEENKIKTKNPFTWIEELAASSDQSPHRIEAGIKKDFFSHRVFVFTPDGSVIDLPENSTPVDFAFQVHTELGLTISGAEINGKFKALNTSLHNGDIVNILTKRNAKPNKKWLEFVKTDMAKRKIRNFWEKEEKKK